ncbi:PLP-dependent aminotransferase family protein [Pelagibacterium montanilacus]|uniref:aminotransferase-like domain-containing protein n=1 Tax=Pelagibacterium montanilacus TaxID=2185280 RepID=UPI0019CFDE6F|nr:PLP-dependent aminotransferase family protein [Pelagibacterium montanilacus]
MAQTRTEMVMDTITGRIAARSLSAGARLPSVRAMARSQQVSVSTVVEAYNRLAAEGAIRARPGSGFYVADQLAPMALAAMGPRLEMEIDPFWVSRQSLVAQDARPKPGCGWLPPSWLPEASLRRALRKLARAEASVFSEYGTPLGLAGLRQLIARRLAERGVPAAPDRIVLTESGTQAIDLVCRLLLEPGDTVLVDDPCYFNFQALLRAHRVRIVGVPHRPDGPDLAAFEAVLGAERPRLYITNCAIHNPTGATLSPAVAHRVLKLADAHGMTIVEDDIFADFETTPAPRLAGLDGLERVVQIGSFSKTLSAAARCGFIAARADWIEGLVDLKIATAFGGGRLNEELVLAALSDGAFRTATEAMRARLATARDRAIARLEAMGLVPWHHPAAGMFVWCRMPEGIESGALARRALDRDIVLAPGNVFSVSRAAGRFMRFNVSQMEDEAVLGALEGLLAEG